jgi:TrmH family RNA methyltransferase
MDFETMYVREDQIISADWEARIRAKEWVLLSRDVFDSAVHTETPQGLAATWKITEINTMQTGPAMTLVLEDVQDPGNVGTLIRSAAAFGATEAIATPGCAGEWNPKTLRASAGAVFRMPVRHMSIEEALGKVRGQGARIFAAVAGFTTPVITLAPLGVLSGRMRNEDAEFARWQRNEDGTRTKVSSGSEGKFASVSTDTDFEFPFAILVGNEGAGLSKRALELADEHVQIPCSVESLNVAVAGSILLYEAMRQIPLRVWARKQGLRP